MDTSIKTKITTITSNMFLQKVSLCVELYKKIKRKISTLNKTKNLSLC